MSYTVYLSLWPTTPIVVTDSEALALYAQGLVVSSTPTLGVSVLYGTDTVDGGTPGGRVDLVKVRYGTAAQWATAETSGPMLAAGELAIVDNEFVRGDGTTKVASLTRVGGSTLIDGGTP